MLRSPESYPWCLRKFLPSLWDVLSAGGARAVCLEDEGVVGQASGQLTFGGAVEPAGPVVFSFWSARTKKEKEPNLPTASFPSVNTSISRFAHNSPPREYYVGKYTRISAQSYVKHNMATCHVHDYGVCLPDVTAGRLVRRTLPTRSVVVLL